MKKYSGIEIKKRSTVTYTIELSKDRAECICHQLVEEMEIDISDDSEFPDVADFLNALNDAICGETR